MALSPQPSPEIVSACAEILGAPPTSWRAVERGYTRAQRWIARTAAGRSAFLKVATDDETAAGLAAEWRVYESVQGPFLPRVLGHRGGASPWLVLEDLSACEWPPPWSASRVAAVRRALEQLAVCPAPLALPDAETLLRPDVSGWARIGADPRPFLALGLACAAWLERALPALQRAESEALLAGPAVLHLDVRSDNLCVRGEQAILFDWSWACRGNPDLDLACWAPSLAAEGGPRPEDLLPAAPALAAAISGYFASNAGLPAGPVPERVRRLQRLQLEHALPWAARALGLSPVV